MAEIKLIDFLRAELNSFSGEEISIEDCNRITIRLWNMSNSNFQLCSEAINNLKSKNEKMDFFKTHSLSYLSKLSERLGPTDFVYKIKTDNTKQKHMNEFIEVLDEINSAGDFFVAGGDLNSVPPGSEIDFCEADKCEGEVCDGDYKNNSA